MKKIYPEAGLKFCEMLRADCAKITPRFSITAHQQMLAVVDDVAGGSVEE
jgi:hypothetical protein